MVPSTKLSVLAEITKAPVRVPPVTTKLAVWPYFVVSTVDGTDRYMAIAYNAATNASAEDAYARSPVDLEIVSWTVRLVNALGVGETYQQRFIVDGTPDTGIVISMAEGDQVGSADGSLVIPANTDFAIEGVIGGTLSGIVVLGGIVGYRS